MSHSITVPDDIYEQVAALAKRQGQPVDVLIAQALTRMVRHDQDSGKPENSGLDWSLASAEEIIADLHASRVEREHDIEL